MAEEATPTTSAESQDDAASLIKMRDLNIPYEVLWAKWGASPQEIERWREMVQLPAPPARELPEAA